MFASSPHLLDARWRRRASALLCLLLALFVMLAARLIQLSVIQGAEREKDARRNTIIHESVPAPRGRIYDRKGRLLVTNRPVFDLYVVPAEVIDPDVTLRKLSAVFHKPQSVFNTKFQKATKMAPLEDLVLVHSLDDEALTKISPIADSTRGVYLGSRGERTYRYGTVGSHIFGYMGAISTEALRVLRSEGFTGRDFVGKTGLEDFYDKQLRGQRGVLDRWVDANGRTLKTELIRPAVPGNDLYLNIDMKLQLTAEKALSESLDALAVKNHERSGAAAVVFKVNTGEILAMASLPNFDPKPFARGVTQKEYSALLGDENTPLVNRATDAAFSPGSTFKMITGMAALELGLTGPGSSFYCGGSYKGANCFVRSGHGHISFPESIAQSCDVVFYRLGDLMGIRSLAKFSRAAGLGSETDIDLPGEDPGLIPSPEWKKKVWEEPWYGGDTINSSIGQGFILVTPLQMARATAAVANGGKVYKPRLLDRSTTSGGQHFDQNSVQLDNTLPVKAGYLEAIKSGMRGAVNHGTSTVADSPEVKVSGKTGTVESFPNPYNPHGRNHTWFVCFAPYAKPEISIAVFFQKSGGYGGGVAAPVARAIIDTYYGDEKQ